MCNLLANLPATARTACAIGAALALIAPAVARASLSVDAETITLPNGMTVTFYEDHSLPQVVVNTWFHVGSKDERERRTGFAHLFEHLMFMGTERVPDAEYDLILEGGGGWSNASTSNDRTNYYAVGPSAILPTILWMEADRLDGLATAMTQEKLDAQRAVVRNERRESENSPYGNADLKIDSFTYPPGHPYHHTVIGSHEDLEAATVEDVVEFFETYYVPGNATVVIAGDFDTAKVRPIVEQTFGALPAKPTPEHKTAPQPVATGETRLVETDKVEFPRLTLQWVSPPYFQDGDGEMDIISEILSGGSASRLEKALVLDTGLAQNVVSYQASKEISSEFVVVVTAAPGGDLEEIKRIVLSELDRFAAEGPTEDELKRARAQMEAGFLRSMESLTRRADRLNMYRHYFGTADGFDRDLARWTEPSAKDVRAWAETVFGGGRVDMRVYPEGSTVAGASLDVRPDDFAPGTFVPPIVQSFELSNGIALHAVSRPGTQLFSGSLLVNAGENQVPDAKSGLAALSAEMMQSGAGGLSVAEFSEAVESLGATVWVAAGRAYTTVGVSGISSKLEEALDLFADLALQPNLGEADFEREKGLAIASVRSRSDDPEALARIVGAAMMFDDSDPRHRPFEGTEDTVNALTLDDVRDFVESTMHPGAATFAFVGDFDPEELRDALEKRFKRWKGQGDVPTLAPVSLRKGSAQVVLVDRPDAPQTVIYGSRAIEPLDGVDRAIRIATTTVFGGSFTARANANLREKNGYTYGAFGRIVDRAAYSYQFTTTNVFSDVTGPALVELRKECDGIAGNPPTDVEVVKAVETERTNLVDTAQTTGSIAENLTSLITSGRPLDSVQRDLDALSGVGPDALREFAETGFWNWDRLTIVLVGDKEKVLTQMAEAGFDAPELVDEFGRPVEEEMAAGKE